MDGLTRRAKPDMSNVQPENGLSERRVITANSFRALKLKLAALVRRIPEPSVPPELSVSAAPVVLPPPDPPVAAGARPTAGERNYPAVAATRDPDTAHLANAAPPNSDILALFASEVMEPSAWMAMPLRNDRPIAWTRRHEPGAPSCVASGFCRSSHGGKTAARRRRSWEEGACPSRHYGHSDRGRAAAGTCPCQ